VSWISLTIACLAGFGTVIGGAYLWGRFRHDKEIWELEEAKNDLEKQVNRHKKTAEIFSLPRGDKHDVVGRL
jgi:hypothetical protein